jgi:sugar lactone lactonase YvrE
MTDASVASTTLLPHRNVLYVSDILDTRVDIYPLNASNPAPIGEILSGVDTPTGMAVDASHDLYVANNTTNTITGIAKGEPNLMPVYSPGRKSPSSFYFQDLHHPTDVVVGGDGTVYVASFGDGYIVEYPTGSKTPSLHFQPPSGSPIALALDATNNLYAACTNSNAVFKFAPGSTQGTNLGLVLGGEPHGMAFDARGDLLVAVSLAPGSGSVVDVFRPGTTTPSKKIGGTFQPFMIAFDKTLRNLYVADYGSGNHDGGVFEFAYPSGKLLNKYAQGGATASYGVAVNPPAPLGGKNR